MHNNSRDSSTFSGCSTLQFSCSLTEKCHAICHYSYNLQLINPKLFNIMRSYGWAVILSSKMDVIYCSLYIEHLYIINNVLFNVDSFVGKVEEDKLILITLQTHLLLNNKDFKSSINVLKSSYF